MNQKNKAEVTAKFEDAGNPNLRPKTGDLSQYTPAQQRKLARSISRFRINKRLRSLYYFYRFGMVGQGKSLIAVKKELKRIQKGNKVQRLITPDKDKDSTAEIFFKSIDAANIIIAARTMAWCIGLEKEPPSEFITRNIRLRHAEAREKKKGTDVDEFGIIIKEYLRLSNISKEELLELVEQITTIKSK